MAIARPNCPVCGKGTRPRRNATTRELKGYACGKYPRCNGYVPLLFEGPEPEKSSGKVVKPRRRRTPRTEKTPESARRLHV